MAQSFELAYENTWIQKLDKYLITYESGRGESQIDYILRWTELREHGLKVFERMIDDRLGKIVKIGKQQYVLFMMGRGTVDAIYKMATTGKEARGKPEALLCFCKSTEGA
ncbi:uncharacterized protein [Palaemon carinicauda]|uniref:uncharacterized protein n=1 Tax=Palaemon carinicauda TaxID=392227 RepID=UPI0035B67D7C